MNGSRMTGWLMGGLLAVSLTFGCSLYRNDRCHLNDTQYKQARAFFIQTGSLDLVQRQLEQDLQWRRCQVNEAIYRLQKEFEVLPEELPAQK